DPQGGASDLGQHVDQSLPNLDRCRLHDHPLRAQQDTGLGVVVEALREAEVLDAEGVADATTNLDGLGCEDEAPRLSLSVVRAQSEEHTSELQSREKLVCRL